MHDSSDDGLCNHTRYFDMFWLSHLTLRDPYKTKRNLAGSHPPKKKNNKHITLEIQQWTGNPEGLQDMQLSQVSLCSDGALPPSCLTSSNIARFIQIHPDSPYPSPCHLHLHPLNAVAALGPDAVLMAADPMDTSIDQNESTEGSTHDNRW